MRTLNKLKSVQTREELESLQAEIKDKKERALRESEEYREMVHAKQRKAQQEAEQRQREMDRLTADARRDAESQSIPRVKKGSRMRNLSPDEMRERMKRSMRMIA